jgi:hypothetical protein
MPRSSKWSLSLSFLHPTWLPAHYPATLSMVKILSSAPCSSTLSVYVTWQNGELTMSKSHQFFLRFKKNLKFERLTDSRDDLYDIYYIWFIWYMI